jgi:hypothetical protein
MRGEDSVDIVRIYTGFVMLLFGNLFYHEILEVDWLQTPQQMIRSGLSPRNRSSENESFVQRATHAPHGHAGNLVLSRFLMVARTHSATRTHSLCWQVLIPGTNIGVKAHSGELQ